MGLTENINEQMKLAMKSGDKVRLETLRSLRAGILQFEKSGVGRAMTEEDEKSIVLSAAKSRRDAIEEYTKANRPDLAEKEQAELTILQEFLPQQLSEQEVRLVITRIIADQGASGPGDFGKVMGLAMKELRGRTDGALIQQMVKNLLSNE